MRDLLEPEQRHVRAVIRLLRVRTGGWVTVAAALHMKPESIAKVVCGRRSVTPRLAIRVARLVEVSIDELLAGRSLPPHTCPHCGRSVVDFGDDATIFDATKQAPG